MLEYVYPSAHVGIFENTPCIDMGLRYNFRSEMMRNNVVILCGLTADHDVMTHGCQMSKYKLRVMMH